MSLGQLVDQGYKVIFSDGSLQIKGSTKCGYVLCWKFH